MLGFHSTSNLGKYLGFSLKHPRSSTQDYNFIIEKVQSKLVGWKANLLSFLRRVVLTQGTLTAIPSYIMQGVALPRRVLNSLDKISRFLIWGSTTEKKKLHLLSWKKIAKPKKDGGLGVHAAKPKKHCASCQVKMAAPSGKRLPVGSCS